MVKTKIKDVYGYVKDSTSNAILASRDNKELLAYKARKNSMKKISETSDRLDKLESRIDDVSEKLNTLLDLLINKTEIKGSN